MRVPSIREERRLFYSDSAKSKTRLTKLLRARARSQGSNPGYIIGAGDEVELNVFDIEELNTSAKVRESGFISLPLIGAVRALGSTESDLQEHIRSRLKQFVKDPQVFVSVSNYDSQKISVLGAVKSPGSYSLSKSENNILEALSLAGGLTERAGSYVNFVPSEGGRSNSNKAIEVALQDLLGTSGDIPIQIPILSGDMIIVPEAGQVMVEGEVEKRGAYDLAGRTTLLGALASAGGITYGAKVDEVEVIRQQGNAKRRLIVNLEQILSGEVEDVPLRNGDLIRVPSHSGRRMRQDTFEGITRIINFGVGGTVNMAPR